MVYLSEAQTLIVQYEETTTAKQKVKVLRLR